MVFLESPLLIQHYVGNLEQVAAAQRKQRFWHQSAGNNPSGECKLGTIMLLNHIGTCETLRIFSGPTFIAASKYYRLFLTIV